jgi:acetyl-CoA carboxylase carboxyltransferase component
MGWTEALAQLDEAREAGKQMGGLEAIARVHARGKLTPRERIDLLLDPGTFREIGELVTGLIRVPGRPDRVAPCDGVVCGWGAVDGRRVFVVADDGTIAAGARGPGGGRKAAYVRALATNQGFPLVLLLESSAGRLQGMMGAQFAGAAGGSNAGVAAPEGAWAQGGSIPVVSAIMGTALGAASFGAIASEFTTITTGTAAMAMGGPPVVLGGIGQEVDTQELGGAEVHATITGFVDYVAGDDADNVAAVRRFLGYFPDNSRELPPRVGRGDPPDRRTPELIDIVPLDHRRPYDMHRIIRAIVDDGAFLEVKERFGRNVITGYARLNGYSVGIIANQPSYMGGIVDVKAAIKVVRLAQTCDAYNIPLIFLQDQPGFIVGPTSEREGALRQIVRMMNMAYSFTTPALTVLIRKAYGFSTWLLGGRNVGADLVVAWPSASVSLAGPEVAVNTLMTREAQQGDLSPERSQELYAYYRKMSQARWAAYDFRIDDVIEPDRTREVLAKGLEMALRRRAKNLSLARTIDP